MGKSMLAGAALAALVVAVLAVGGLLYVRNGGAAPGVDPTDRVVLVFESPAEDGATVAALISVVSDGAMHDVSPESSVTIPGTSFSRLGDAFVFGGGAAIAQALSEREGGGPTAYVSVPQKVWRSTIDGVGGVTLNVPSKVTVFDGKELVTIPAGEQRLSADQVSTLLRGLSYLDAAQSVAVRTGLEERLAGVLAKAGTLGDQVDSDLTPETLDSWLRSTLASAAER